MRFFFLHDYHDWLLAVFLGLVLAILIYVAFRSYRYSSQRAGIRPRKVFDYADGLKGETSPCRPLSFSSVWAFSYGRSAT